MAEEWQNDFQVKSVDVKNPPDIEAIKNADAEQYIFVAVGDLTREIDEWISSMREEHPCGILGMVLLAEDFDGFKCKNMAAHLHQYIENCDNVFFATKAEKDLIQSVMFADSITAGASARDICWSMIAFPRLHFFTLMNKEGKTCGGQEVPDASLLFTSAKIGADAPVCDKAKFSPRCFIKKESDEKEKEVPLHFVTLPGNGDATVVMCIKVLTDILTMAVEAGFEDGYLECPEEGAEAESNVNDLICEFQQYAGAPYEEDEDCEYDDCDG
jgi:hypothetical protein